MIIISNIRVYWEVIFSLRSIISKLWLNIDSPLQVSDIDNYESYNQSILIAQGNWNIKFNIMDYNIKISYIIQIQKFKISLVDIKLYVMIIDIYLYHSITIKKVKILL